MSKIGQYEIPFDAKTGNQLHYPESGWRYELEWRENVPFNDTLTIAKHRRGRSSAVLIFTREGGTEVTMFMKDLVEAFDKIEGGKLSGKFQFTKRGANYGIKRIGDRDDG